MSHKRSFRIIVQIGPSTLDQAVEILEIFRQTGAVVTTVMNVSTSGAVEVDPCPAGCEDTPTSGPRSTLDRSAN